MWYVNIFRSFIYLGDKPCFILTMWYVNIKVSYAIAKNVSKVLY